MNPRSTYTNEKIFLFSFFFMFSSFNTALSKEIIHETEITVLGVPITTKQKTFIGTGKATIELEDNDSSRLEVDERQEFYKSDVDKNKDDAEQRLKKKEIQIIL